MKTVVNFLLVLGLITFTQACMQAPEGEKAQVEEAATPAPEKNAASAEGTAYKVDPTASSITWKGTKAGGKEHQGTINISQGKLTSNGNNITAGKFMLDMTSITVADLEGNMKAKLEGHLASPDFFDSANHGSGSFEIVSVEKADGSDPNTTHRIKGNLTLKDITKAITIPAKVTAADGKLMAQTPAFTINRTEWDVNYGSTVVGTIADQLIHDEVGLAINLVANTAEVQ